MPVSLPVQDPATGEVAATDYYTPSEVADLLHLSRTSVLRGIKHRGWPHLRILDRYLYMSLADVAAVVGSGRMAATEDPPPRRIGVPADDDTAPLS